MKHHFGSPVRSLSVRLVLTSVSPVLAQENEDLSAAELTDAAPDEAAEPAAASEEPDW